MKGVILSRFPEASIVDLAHDIPTQWPPEAGFWISRSYRYFPDGTVHVAIVDPGGGGGREILLVESDGHTFVAPDNGLLAPLLADTGKFLAFHLDIARLTEIGIDSPSLTFQGRDIFAPLAAELASGRLRAADLGKPTQHWTPGWIDAAEPGPNRVSGVVVTVDAFGNLISNIDASLIAGFSRPIAHIAGHELALESTYARVRPGDYLALINSFGVLEIARSEGDAATGLGSERGAPITVTEQIG